MFLQNDAVAKNHETTALQHLNGKIKHSLTRRYIKDEDGRTEVSNYHRTTCQATLGKNFQM